MVRPIRPNEKDDASFRYGDLDAMGGAGFVGGSSGGATTGGGQFTGDGQGTGFVNAKDYLGANMGKGAALGEKVTADADRAIADYSSASSDLSGVSVPTFNPLELPDGFVDERPTPRTNAPAPGEIPKVEEPGKGYYERRAEEFARRPNAYKGPGAADIDQKYKALSELNSSGVKLKNLYNPNTPESRGHRETRLNDMAKDAGVSYGSGSRGFDSMLMEAESPDLFKRRYDALDNALANFDSMDEEADRKKGLIKGAIDERESYDARKEAEYREKARQAAEKQAKDEAIKAEEKAAQPSWKEKNRTTGTAQRPLPPSSIPEYDPSAYDPAAYDPGAGTGGGAYDPGTYDPSGYDPSPFGLYAPRKKQR